jgi:hypothetical protein
MMSRTEDIQSTGPINEFHPVLRQKFLEVAGNLSEEATRILSSHAADGGKQLSPDRYTSRTKENFQ